jgi:hypothetical protein
MALTLQDVKALLERQWRCRYREKSGPKTEVLIILYNLQVDSNWSYRGREAFTIIGKGVNSTVTVPIKGRVYLLLKEKAVMLTFEEGKKIEGRQLPGMTWCPCGGTFYLYRDADNPGRCFWEGDVACNCSYGIERQHWIFR